VFGDATMASLKLRDFDMKNQKSKKVANLRNKPGERRKRSSTSGAERRRVAKEAPASNIPTPPTYKIDHIAVDEIEVGSNRRKINQEKLDDLKRSIAKIGLRTPLTIRSFSGRKKLVAGGHRLEAVKALGHKTVPCMYIAGGTKAARLWVISENLDRAELTVLEESEFIAEWLELTEEAGKEVSAQNGQKGKAGRPKGGMSDAARNLPGKGTHSAKRHKIARAAKIAAIDADVKREIVDAKFADSAIKLGAIASKPDKEAQLKELHRLKAGRKKSDADGERDPSSADETLLDVIKREWRSEKKLSRANWERAKPKDRKRVITDVLKYPLAVEAEDGDDDELDESRQEQW
jgi:ParB-like chromosome segregation protein Spo0J